MKKQRFMKQYNICFKFTLIYWQNETINFKSKVNIQNCFNLVHSHFTTT